MAFTLKEPTAAEALLLAHARLGHPEEVASLIESKISTECNGLYGTPLVEACRAEHCTQLHVLTAQLLLDRKANVDATDWFGATALLHAALRCSVLPEIHIQVRYPAPGVDMAPTSAVTAAGADNVSEAEKSSSRSSKRYSLHRSLSAKGSNAYNIYSSSDESGGERLADNVVASGLGDTTEVTLQRPRFASDGMPRHIQLVTMLLNGKCNVKVRSRNGVSAIAVLCASPSTDAVAVLEWVIESALGHSAPYDAKDMEDPIWDPDSVGANIVHYAAYAANVDALRLFQRIFDDEHLRKLAGTHDYFGRSPVDLLNLYPEETILSSSRTGALRKNGMYPEVPFENRRREFRTLLTTIQ